jgi:AraC family transcriptional regulator
MRPTTLSEYRKRLLRVLVHVQQHLDEPLELEALAARAYLSPYHFHRVFTGMAGESLKSHIRRLRLERAATRLKLSRRSVLEIALEAGYETHEAFTRAFRANFGRSPSSYRARHRPPRDLRSPSEVHYRKDRPPGTFRPTPAPGAEFRVRVKTLRPVRVAFMRHVGPYRNVGSTWDRFLMWMGKEGLLGAGSQFIGICHDDPDVTPARKVRYDVCVSVDEGFAPEGEVGVQVIPGGDHATLTHYGPYRRIGESYARLLGGWLPRSGRDLRPLPCFETYLNSPESTDPEDLVTDLHAPLHPR